MGIPIRASNPPERPTHATRSSDYDLEMRSAVLVLSVACACSDASGFAGTYEGVSATRGACGAETAEPVRVEDQFFRLDDVDVTGGLLVAYYACVDPDRCEDLYDLSRSFGRDKTDDSRWAGYVSSAIPSLGCMLSHRIRRLTATKTGVQIATEVYRMTDGTLMGADCDQAVASERGTTMPCVEASTLVAEDR